MRYRLKLMVLPLVISIGLHLPWGARSAENDKPLFALQPEEGEYTDGWFGSMGLGPFHVHGHVVVHTRRFPTLSDQTLTTVGGAFHWEPLPFLSFGPYYRGLSTFISGTDTTSVTTSLNEVGLSVNFFPVWYQPHDELFAFRWVIMLGGLINIQKVTFTHSFVQTSSLSATTTTLVIPIEFAFELIVSKVVSLKYFLGFTAFKQAEGIYHGPALGIIF